MNSIFRSLIAVGSTIILALTITGCAVLGPQTLKAGRNEYNEALARTEQDELLLNIVRLRFSEKPYFLDVASISSAAEISASLGARYFGSGQESGPQAGIGYSESPTIIYQPLAGEKFVEMLLTPLDLKTLLLLRQAGFEIDDIMGVFVNRMNGVPNAPTGADSTPEGVPEYKEFDEVVEALDELEDNNTIHLAASEENEEELVIIMEKRGRETEVFLNFAQVLGLNPKLDRYRIRIGLTEGGDGEILVDTRPILAAMFFLGQGIRIPEEIRQKGIVNITTDNAGQPFEWNNVLGNTFIVHSSKQRPEDSHVAIQYYGYWYYIDSMDVNTRETLTMLGIVFTLKAGGISSKAPVLTLPVGGG